MTTGRGWPDEVSVRVCRACKAELPLKVAESVATPRAAFPSMARVPPSSTVPPA